MKQRRLVPQHDLWNDLVLAEEYLGHPLPQLARTFRRDLFSDELYMAVPSLEGTRPAARSATTLCHGTGRPRQLSNGS
jgi:hypothetical protein